ncbi:MAG: hypothetical protein JWP57_268 [Spirosoma sp.]|nr:hypothetical protein [Spirosoma sp.]
MYILKNGDFLSGSQRTGEKVNRLLPPDHQRIDHERDTFPILIRQGLTP